MAPVASNVPSPSPEHRRIAAGQFERANQVVAAGDYDYGIRLLLSCCKLDPANLVFRQTLRRVQKLKYRNNLRGSWFAWLTTAPAKARVRKRMMAKDYLAVLEVVEHVLTRNPWHVRTQEVMADAAERLGLLELAVWTLEQARQKAPDDVDLSRRLARLYERRGNFTQAIALWELIRKAAPDDVEAMSKAKNLAASETISRGQYQKAIDADEDETGAPVTSRRRKKKHAQTAAVDTPLVEEASDPGERRHAQEIATLRARIEADPANPNTYLQLAGLYRRTGQIDKARSLLITGLVPSGNHFELTAEIADLEIEPFRQNLAITEQRLSEQDEPDEELRRIRIRLLKEINARELELYRQKADRQPGELGNRFELGVRLLRAGQTDEAIRELQAARAEPRWYWKSLLYLGYCFKSRNNWKLARRNFEEALAGVPSGEDAARKEIYFQLASGSAEANELQDAVNFGTELANLDFSFREIGHLLDEWQARLSEA
jgi:tetratricopeptide (TPR) repeat protein